MLAGSLQDELLAIPGIAGAEFEGSIDQPAGVRVQLAVGADADAVGREVQRILASHGMRSQMADETPSHGSVVNLSDYEADTQPAAVPAVPPEADVELMDGPVPDLTAPQVQVDTPPVEVDTPPAPAAPLASATMSAIAGVAVEEDDTQVVLTVRSTSGSAATRTVAPSPEALDHAAASAAAELAGDVPARVVAVTDADVEGSPIVTVLFDVGLRRVAGAAVVQGSRHFAVARAAWSALRG